MFKQLGESYHQSFQEFMPYANASNREAFHELSDELKHSLIVEGERYLNYNYPALPIRIFMSYQREGNRVNFEDIYFQRRYALNALILAECVEYKGRFLDDIINGIFTLCEESAWQLPPHNSNPGGPNELLPDITNPVLDLFACETGALISTAYYLLKDALNHVHPFITKRMLYEVNTRVVTPYLTKHFGWMGDGDARMSNWTIWCVQNCLISIFLTDQSDEVKKQAFLKSCISIDCFIKDYGEDGCCEEGAQYYHHAGLCLFNALEVLNAVTNGHFSSLYSNLKIKNMATYIQNVHIKDKYYINFADCSPVAGRVGAREYLFAKRVGDDNMMRFAAKDFYVSDDKLLLKEMNLFYHLQSTFTYDEMLGIDTALPIHYLDIYYESVGLLIARDDVFTLAVKAGNNGDSHNHNDTGSIILYKEDKPVFLDLGVETYCAKTFSDRRYEIWTMQSAYHNLPTIRGFMQLPGRDYKAKDISVSLSDSIVSISMNLVDAYPKETNLKSYIRTVTLNKGRSLTLKDTYSFYDDATKLQPKGNVTLSFMTEQRVTVSKEETKNSKEAVLLSIGNLAKMELISYDAASFDIVTEEIKITDARLQTAWTGSVYRTLITPSGNSFSFTIDLSCNNE